jgi:hypothetical protein
MQNAKPDNSQTKIILYVWIAKMEQHPQVARCVQVMTVVKLYGSGFGRNYRARC